MLKTKVGGIICTYVRTAGEGPTAHYSSQIPVCPPFFGVSVFFCLCLFSLFLFSHPAFYQFIFQFAPGNSQVRARRKFAEAAGAPLEATQRRDRRVTIRPSPPLLYRPLILFSLSLSSSLTPPFSSVTSLPGYTGPQGDLLLAWVP